MRSERLVLGVSFILILIGFGAFLYAKSKSEPVNQWWFAKSNVGKHHVGEPFFMSWRTRISLEWSSPVPVTIGVARLQDLNGVLEGRGKPLLSMAGIDGTLDFVADQDGDYVLILDADVKGLKDLSLQGTVTMSYPPRPYLWVVPLSAGLSLLASAIILHRQQKFVR